MMEALIQFLSAEECMVLLPAAPTCLQQHGVHNADAYKVAAQTKLHACITRKVHQTA